MKKKVKKAVKKPKIDLSCPKCKSKLMYIKSYADDHSMYYNIHNMDDKYALRYDSDDVDRFWYDDRMECVKCGLSSEDDDILLESFLKLNKKIKEKK